MILLASRKFYSPPRPPPSPSPQSASASLTGSGVYGTMKFEAGVHRVQRVPATEAHGRLHTSTMSVAVLPQPRDIEVVINSKDIQVDTFRATG